jgi:hypothetical protein
MNANARHRVIDQRPRRPNARRGRWRTQILEKRNTHMEQQARLPLIGEKAPSFKAESTQARSTFLKTTRQVVIFFSHPADFTPSVPPSS